MAAHTWPALRVRARCTAAGFYGPGSLQPASVDQKVIIYLDKVDRVRQARARARRR